MKVRLIVHLGVRGGRRWPPAGRVVDIPDDEARALCVAGEAVPVPRGTLVDLVLAPVVMEEVPLARG